MNIVFCIIIILSISYLIFTNPNAVLLTLTSSAESCVKFIITMVGIYGIWLGFMKIVEKCGLSNKLAKLLSPVIKFLFGDISDNTKSYISLNMSGNILGLGNAATPMGINAIESMNTDNSINKNMIMLLVINSTGLQLLPTTIISLRQSLGSSSPADIILPSIIAGLVSTFVGIMLCKIFVRDKKKTNALPLVSTNQSALPACISKSNNK